MGFLAWIVVGIIAGFLAKMIMPGSRAEPGGFLGTMLLGIVGAVLGGWGASLLFNEPGATGINIWSVLVATIGACIALALARMFSRSHA